MSTSPVIISASLTGTRELIAELGADPEPLVANSGLPLRAFEEPDLYVRADRVLDYFELAADACRRPEFALIHARRLPLATLGHGWMIMRSAETIGDALMDFVRLYGLYTDAGTLRSQRHPEGLLLEYSILPVGHYGATQIINLTLACLCVFVRESLARQWCPVRTNLSQAQAPRDPRSYVELFGPHVHFGQDTDAIVVDQHTLAIRLGDGAARREIHRAMMHQAGRGPAVIAQVKALIRAYLRFEHFTVDTIGAALGISGRTLQRRLTAADTSFREVLDEVRADFAWRHVRRSSLHFGHIAELLGYDSPAAFSRAFRRWHGTSPQCARAMCAGHPEREDDVTGSGCTERPGRPLSGFATKAAR